MVIGYVIGCLATALAALFILAAGRCRCAALQGRLRIQLATDTWIEGERLMARITNEQKVKITVVPTTAAGHPAPIDGEVEFLSDNVDVAVVERIDATSAYVLAVAPGAALISASFDADLGEGVRTVTATGALEVVAAEAETAEITFGEPELQ